MSDRVLVTGISGFLGGHVALQLLRAGYRVRGSIRDPAKAARVRDALARHGADIAALELVTLDLLDDAGWAAAMADVRYLQHVASPFVTRMPADADELIRPAVEGTRRALGAAFASGVERVVLTSSMAAVMYGHPRDRRAPFTAADWTRLGQGDANAYIQSKTLAEQAAWELAGRLGRSRDLVAVNPGAILGPLLDDDPGTSAAIVIRMLDGSMPAAPRVPLIVVDVRDVAALQLAAMRSETARGQRFPVGNGTYTLLQLARMLRPVLPERAGRLPRFEVPDWTIRLIALFDRDLRDNLTELGFEKSTEAAEAKALLGRPFIPMAETLADTARSLLAQRLV